MLIQIVLSYHIVLQSAASLKESIVFTNMFWNVGQNFGDIFEKDVCLQQPKVS